jgi:hypothetical protein
MKNLALAFAAAVALATPLAVYAQDLTHRQMEQVISTAQRRGFALTSQYYRGSLDDGRITEVNVTLASNDEQMIAAVCDGDCSDIDLSVYETDGREIGSDRGNDDYPLVFVPTGHAGAHRVRVSMANCHVNPCRYELAVFSR